jgi:hypothetical protein
MPAKSTSYRKCGAFGFPAQGGRPQNGKSHSMEMGA